MHFLKSRFVESREPWTRMSIVHDCATFWPTRSSLRPVLAGHSLRILPMESKRAERRSAPWASAARPYYGAGWPQQDELLRVLCASKAPTQRTRRVSVTSVFSLFLTTENTEKNKSWRHDSVSRTSAREPPDPSSSGAVEAGFSRALLHNRRVAALKRASTKNPPLLVIPLAHFSPNGVGVIKGCAGAGLHLEARFVDFRRVEDARV